MAERPPLPSPDDGLHVRSTDPPTSAPYLLEICPRCHAADRVRVGQRLHGDEIHWLLSFACATCGAVSEAHGAGPGPPDVRQAILEVDGLHCLIVDAAASTAMLGALRRLLNLDIAGTIALRKTLPGRVGEGTRLEMERLLNGLAAVHVPSRMVRCEGNQ